MPVKAGKLVALFDDLNRRYFRGRLPKYCITVRAGLLRKKRCEGICISKQHQIVLDGGLTQDQLIGVLLHEMAHAATGRDFLHGEDFQREMHRLHALGAPLCDDEVVVKYAKFVAEQGHDAVQTISVSKASFKRMASDILMEHPELTAREVLKGIAYHELKLPVTRLVRRYPWVRRAVAEAWREAREERFLSSLFRQVGEGGLQVDLAKLKPFERAALKQAMRVMGLKAKPGKDGRK